MKWITTFYTFSGTTVLPLRSARCTGDKVIKVVIHFIYPHLAINNALWSIMNRAALPSVFTFGEPEKQPGIFAYFFLIQLSKHLIQGSKNGSY